MNLKSIISTALLTSISMSLAHSQTDDIYITPSTSMITFPNVVMAIHGDIINDAQGGLNHAGGGKIILYKSATATSGASRIYDGPLSVAHNGMYNDSGSYIRVYDLVTDNATNTAIPSGTQINLASGAGDIQVEQEVRVSHEHSFQNGVVWTPRDLWQHAYVHYEDSAYYTGAASNNSSGPHIDGYAAHTGQGDFIFPIGDGSSTRMAGVTAAAPGIYKAAYFSQNAQLGTTGISGTSATSSPMASPILAVSTQEFWDIDGTGTTKITLSSDNSTGGYSDWALDFASTYNDASQEIGITGWDDWEYLGSGSATNDIYNTGFHTSNIAVNPDSLGMQGNPYSAFTWASASLSNLSLQNLKLDVAQTDCNALLSLTLTDEEGTKEAHILRTDDKGLVIEVGTITLKGSTEGTMKYTFVDSTVESKKLYLYTARIEYTDGSFENSAPVSLFANCDVATEWTVYPNPTKGKITLSCNQDIHASAIRVIDMRGRIVQNIYITDPHLRSYPLSLEGYSDGLYIINLTDEENNPVYQHVVNLKSN